MTTKSVFFGARRADVTGWGGRNSISRSPLRRGFLLIPFAIALAWLALSPAAQAAPLAPPDGGYPPENTAEGDGALGNFISVGRNKNSADGNTAIGFLALHDDTGNFNTAVGDETLQHNTSGHHNTATGTLALSGHNTGSFNTATGSSALGDNQAGNNNTANGANALFSNNGSNNTATGFEALLNNTEGHNNTATGFSALNQNKAGSFNTANGPEALQNNISGNFNTAVGPDALSQNKDGNGNIALGVNAGANLITGSNKNIDIGNPGVARESKTIRIGAAQTATYIAGIAPVASSGQQVIVGTDGKLGTMISSERFKEAIKPMDKASEAILALKPVTFRYKRKLDPEGIPQFGLVAEQVEKVNPDLVARDDQGKVITVRYEAVNAMLLNEFLKQHRKVQKLEAAIARQQEEIKALTASVKEQASQIRKVSAQLEVRKAAPRMVVNNQ